MSDLFTAIRANQPDEVERLIKEGANLQAVGDYGLTPLQMARILDRVECARVFGEEVFPIQLVKDCRLTEISQESFGKIFSCAYLPHLRASDPCLLETIYRRCLRGRREGFFDARRRWLGAFHRKDMERGRVANVAIQWIGEALGYGLFAAEDFAAHQYVGLYTGDLVLRDWLKRNVTDYCFRLPTGGSNLRPIMIDAERAGNEMRFINHSDNPNVEAVGVPFGSLAQVMMRTLKDVARGEQFTCDYGIDFWKSRSFR